MKIRGAALKILGYIRILFQPIDQRLDESHSEVRERQARSTKEQWNAYVLAVETEHRGRLYTGGRTWR
jgi:hypothetical protein